ncbi:MAG TPA: hypothetical protein VFT35_08805 [Gaiellaceae bacterium]|jgi:hypothetical protein|nr:hypothetical protein [Gaiellaceae bacterium]
MSTYYADYPTGREVVAEPQEYPFYAQHPTATARFLAYAEERFEYRDPSELDLTSHRKIRDLARGGYYRPYGMAEITGAEAAGVTAFTVAAGQLILLMTPGAEKVESEYLGTMEGREARPGEPLGTMTAWLMQQAGRWGRGL